MDGSGWEAYHDLEAELKALKEDLRLAKLEIERLKVDYANQLVRPDEWIQQCSEIESSNTRLTMKLDALRASVRAALEPVITKSEDMYVEIFDTNLPENYWTAPRMNLSELRAIHTLYESCE